MSLPQIIQGGMGIGVSGWRLASAVSSNGQLGIVSGLCLDEILVRKLQTGDHGGHVRRALEHFPIKDVAKKILDRFFKEKGKKDDEPFINIGKHTDKMDEDREDLIVAGGFTEVFLAKEGHKGIVGVNLLEKIQTECMPLLYGCMLAGVDYVTMGAGIPREIPGILDKLSQNMIASLKLSVTNATEAFKLTFNPERFRRDLPLVRPNFLAIVSSNVLATTLAKKSTGKINGFVVESHKAAGHNAPSRTSKGLSLTGEPIYGERDHVDIEKIKEIGLPFWLAGAYGKKGMLKEALSKGASGIQVGTPFMLSAESGVTDEYKNAILTSDKHVFTDPSASPTGFPFKVIQVDGTLSEEKIYEERPRICNLGYLREWYQKEDGTLGARCSAEPVNAYLAKGGCVDNTKGSKCLCNALLANIGLPGFYKNGYTEKPLLTGGDVLPELDYIKPGITAKEIIDHLLED